MKITIQGELPSLNEIISAAKVHYGAYSKMKKDATKLVMWSVSKLPKMKRVELDIVYYCKNRRKDPDNIAAAKKFILDGLVDAAVIKNDGWKEVAGWSEKWEVDKENPRIEVDIKEV